jgi:hypothetical protein
VHTEYVIVSSGAIELVSLALDSIQPHAHTCLFQNCYVKFEMNQFSSDCRYMWMTSKAEISDRLLLRKNRLLGGVIYASRVGDSVISSRMNMQLVGRIVTIAGPPKMTGAEGLARRLDRSSRLGPFPRHLGLGANDS